MFINSWQLIPQVRHLLDQEENSQTAEAAEATAIDAISGLSRAAVEVAAAATIATESIVVRMGTRSSVANPIGARRADPEASGETIVGTTTVTKEEVSSMSTRWEVLK